MSTISHIEAREILDSRGNPTLEVDVFAEGGIVGGALVPSGASTGIHEAVELRDGGKRFLGKGVSKAAKNAENLIKQLKDVPVTNQAKIDRIMLKADGTANKKKLGANAILGVSLACARAGSIENGIPLYRHLARLAGQKRITLPVPFCNVINGGKHADGPLKFQEFMFAPIRAKSYSDAVRMVSETYHVLKEIIEKRYGKMAGHVGDEGGFAPPIKTAEQALNLLQKAVDKTGYDKEIDFAMDAAASEFYKKGYYYAPKKMSAEKLSDYYLKLIDRYDLISLEDPFAEDDFDAWKGFTKQTKIQVVGDDLLVTNTKRMQLAKRKNLCNALLLKVNQIGSVSESLKAALLAKKYKWKTMVSHRSGETEDPFIADLAVGLGCGQIKIGAPCRSERTAKYNQLLRIEEDLGSKAQYASWK